MLLKTHAGHRRDNAMAPGDTGKIMRAFLPGESIALPIHAKEMRALYLAERLPISAGRKLHHVAGNTALCKGQGPRRLLGEIGYHLVGAVPLAELPHGL